MNSVGKKKSCSNMRVLKLLQDLVNSCLKVLVRVRIREKPLVRNENSSSVFSVILSSVF